MTTCASPQQLEQMYEELALAIDRAGQARETLFLARLALTLGHRLGDVVAFRAAVATALSDMPDAASG